MKSGLKKSLAILLICVLLIVFAFIVYKQINNYVNGVVQIKNDSENYCAQDSDCVEASCCHADKCVNVKNAPDCKGLFCTQECSSILDCGKASCKCIDNKCAIKVGIK